jgi:hypothetical protein
MQEKLAELNRPPSRAILTSLFDEYVVTWADLYPSGTSQPTFLSTQNKFIHSSENLPPELVFREAVRVQAVTERLILRMLGWKTRHRGWHLRQL